jgi:hypothetical protein
MCDPETYCMKIPKEVNTTQIKFYDFCCIIYPWELYLMEFDLYLETMKNGYTLNVLHYQACIDILLDNDFNKIMSLYTQDYQLT